MFIYKRNIFFVLYMMTSLISIIFCSTCNDSVDEEIKFHPRRGYYEPEHIIKSIEVFCYNVIFPLDYGKRECGNCHLTLWIKSLFKTTIPSAAFTDFSNYNIFHLNNLGITTISPGAFGQHYLIELHLSGNQLKEIGLGIFNSFANLKVLDLSDNKINKLSTNCFSGMPNLKMLNLSLNDLTNFPFDVLDPGVNAMNYFDIGFNHFSNFTFDKQIDIMNLSLNNNELKLIDFCPFTFNLLNLGNNLLETLPEDTCIGAVINITFLDVSFNEISTIEQFYFKDASSLEYLFLNHNNISNITTGVFFNLINLKVLNLSENHLQQFQHGTFDSLENLEILDLSSNNIKNIDTELHALHNLKKLYLPNNNLKNINVNVLYNLETISFYDNDFSCTDLVKIIYSLNCTIVYGNVRNASNVHGIACSDTQTIEQSPNNNFENLKLNIENIVNSLLKETNNKNNEEKDVLKDYFNNDFKNSNFYKFMANFQESNTIKFNETEIFKYFNNDFEKSKFYRYLESLKDSKNFTDFKKNMYDYFNEDFKNSGFVKYLEDLKNYKIFLNEDFSKSNNYFNKDFEKSNFFNYLESLKDTFSFRQQDKPDFEKFVSTEISEDKKMLAGMIALMVIICFLMIILVYILVYKLFYSTLPKPREQVELL